MKKFEYKFKQENEDKILLTKIFNILKIFNKKESVELFFKIINKESMEDWEELILLINNSDNAKKIKRIVEKKCKSIKIQFLTESNDLLDLNMLERIKSLDYEIRKNLKILLLKNKV